MSSFSAEKLRGVSLVLVAGISWGVISLFIRPLCSYGFTSVDVASVRSVCTCLILLAVVPFINRRTLKCKLRDLWCMAGCGILSITMFNCLYFAAMQRTTVNVAVVLLYTSPVFVTAMSCIFFKEKFTLVKLLALLLVLIGCALVSGVIGHLKLSPLILLLGIGSGFAYALYSIFGRFAQNRGYSSDSITLWTFIFSGAASLFLADWGNVAGVLCQQHSAWIPLIGITLVSTILPYWTYTAGLKHLQPSAAAIIVSIEPLVGTLVGTLFFGESITGSAIAGMVFILTSCALCL